MRLDAILAKALSHPMRVEVLELLEQEEASPAGLTRRIGGVALGLVAYHVEVLENCGLIELVGTRPRRGAIEHFYRAKPAGAIELQGVPKALRGNVTATTLQKFVDTAVAALEDGALDHPEEAVMGQTTVRVDEIGWRQAMELGRTTIDALHRIGEESRDRTPPTMEDVLVPLVFAIACFAAAQTDEQPS
jgi:DNA-binding transcriptional ArsR family regulator